MTRDAISERKIQAAATVIRDSLQIPRDATAALRLAWCADDDHSGGRTTRAFGRG